MGRGLGSQVINPAKYFIVGGSGSAAGFFVFVSEPEEWRHGLGGSLRGGG